jgi:hypothetical protein
LAIVLSVLLRYTDSDNPFGIFKLFFHQTDFTSFNLIDRNLSSFYLWIFNCLIIFFSIFSSCLWYLMYKSTISTCIYKQ